MKILFLNTCYPYGSTGKIVAALENYYNEVGHTTTVVYGQGKKTDDNHFRVANDLYLKIQALRRRVTGIMYGGCFFSTKKVQHLIQKYNPDIVHLHCLNSNFVNIFKLITWLKENHIPTVLTNHAEFMYTANCGYAFECQKYQTGCGNCPRLKAETRSWFVDGTQKSWRMMQKAFDGFDSLVITNVSPWLAERAASSTILKNFNHYTVLNGVDTTVFHYTSNYNSNETKTVLHVTAKFSEDINDRKGGRYVIELAKKFEGQNVKFIVAGKYSPDIVVPANVELLGNVADQNQLAELYSKADVVVLTSKKETFSMITAESLCCGTPVVGFKAGSPELIAIREYSEFVEHGDVEALYNATQKLLVASVDKVEIAKAAHEKYSKEKMAEEYIKIYKKCI
jgi:glycosyltransferase involved in cell wall biosynthesis